MDAFPEQFRDLQRQPNEELNECCERLFEQLDSYSAEYTKRKASIWPLQMMLLILCPKVYFDSIKKALTGSSHHANKQQLTISACVSCVKLCKAATYVNITDSTNVFFALLHSVIDDVKALLFNPVKPLFRNSSNMNDVDVMIDCFVALFRLNYNNEVFRACLQAQSNTPHQIPRLPWWPKIDLVYSRSNDLRNIFNETLSRVTQSTSGLGLSSALSSSGHMPIKVTQVSLITYVHIHIWQKMSQITGKFRERTGFAYSDDLQPSRQLLFWLIRLICTDPVLFLHERLGSRNESEMEELHNSSSELINGLVSLLSFSQTMPEIVQEAMELPNYSEILRWLRHLLICRNAYLLNNREVANFGSNESLCKKASAKLETTCFLYLWSLDSDAVLTAMSMFRLLSEEIEIRCGVDDLPADYYVFAELASATNLQSAGRAALQKSINCHLRRVKFPTYGCMQAWEDTFRYWDIYTKYLKSYSKNKTDEAYQLVESLHRILAQRKVYRNPDHELEDIVILWANMTGFLCALGGACLQQSKESLTPRVGGQSASVSTLVTRRSYSSSVLPSLTDQYCPATRFLNQLISLLFLQSERMDVSVIRHIKEILSHELNPSLYSALFEQIKAFTDNYFDSNGQVVLSSSNTEFLEHVVYIMKNILIGVCPDKPNVKDTRPTITIVCIEPIVITLCRYTKFLESSIHTMTVKHKLCQLIETVSLIELPTHTFSILKFPFQIMRRRDYLTFRQEIRFRNKIVEHLIDWIIGNHPTQTTLMHSPEMNAHIRELDCACMQSVAALLAGLPLQPSDDADRDLMDVKSQIFQKYFSLFMNLLNDCSSYDTGSGFESETVSLKNLGQPSASGITLDHSSGCLPTCATMVQQSRRQMEAKMEHIRCVTVEAMSNLLSANIDSGLVHSLGLGYHKDLRVRVAFAEVLTKILQRGTEFETLNETVLADRYQELVKLVTMITDEGDLPIASALSTVVQSSQLDELARVLVTLFDAKHLLHELLWKMFTKEVEYSESPHTLFRGNTLSSKIMGYCFKMYGSSYLNNLLRAFIAEMVENSDRCYEVDPTRLDPLENLNDNVQNVLIIVRNVFEAIVSSSDRKAILNLELVVLHPFSIVIMAYALSQILLFTMFVLHVIIDCFYRFPSQLRSMCHCLYQVVNIRFPTYGLASVSTMVFLRFINPAIVAPYEHFLMESVPSQRMKRGLMLVSKILQNIANQSTFIKEQCLLPFNLFIQSKFESARRFSADITLNVEGAAARGHTISFLSEGQVSALHRLLWLYQDEVANYFTANRTHTNLSRRLSTLLAQIGPPEDRPSEPQWSTLDWSNTSGQFEEIMSEYSIAERDEYKSIKALSIFYQAGQSKQGNPVFYYIARRFKLGEVNADVLIFHVFQLLSSCNKPFELVIDLTHTSTENRFRTEMLQKWFVRLSDIFYRHLIAVYIYNCNSWIREYTRFHERLLNHLKGSRKMIFLDTIMKLSDYIDPSQQRLPTTTLAFEEDVKVFNNALKLWHKDIKCSVKIGLTALQIVTLDRQKVLGHSVILNDIYYASEVEEGCLVDDNTITLTIVNESSPLSIIHNECEQIVSAIAHIKTCYEMSQPDQSLIHPKIRAKDVPGTLLNMALLNLGSTDPSLRTAAYNLLCALSVTFDFKIEGQLSETEGLLIPANNTIFIKLISEKLALNEPHLTLEFLEECIQGFGQSTIELKHLCLEYMTPWLGNLPRFCKQSGDDVKRQRVSQILDKLINMTIEEFEVRFTTKSTTGGLGSLQAEVLADTTVALAAANTSLVAFNIVNRLMTLLEKTCCNPQASLEEHMLWNDIAILARYLLLLSFNNCLDVVTHLPTLFHFVTVLVNIGPLSLRASIHGLVINIIHSLCTCTSPTFSDEAKHILKLALTEFSLPKFYRLFGISSLTVKSVAATAFRISPRLPLSMHPGMDYGAVNPVNQRDDTLTLPNLETITDALIEILEACNSEVKGRNLVYELSQMSKSFALRFNPALQPRALLVFSCLSKNVDETTMKQLLSLLVQFVKRRDDTNLISAGLMALTRMHPLLPHNSHIHKTLFWVSIIVLQLEDAKMYEHGLALLEQNLRTMDSHGIFEYEVRPLYSLCIKKLEKVVMEVRKLLDWEFKALDQQVGLSFKHNFNFALVAYLLKGLRHPSFSVVSRTVRILNLLLAITAKSTKRDKFDVSQDSIAYLLALLPVSEEVRLRCHLHSSTIRALNMCGSSEMLAYYGVTYVPFEDANYAEEDVVIPVNINTQAPLAELDSSLDNGENSPPLGSSKKVPPPPSPYALEASFLAPNLDALANISVQMPKQSKSITKQRSWTSQVGAAFERDFTYVIPRSISTKAAHRSNSVPLSPSGSLESPGRTHNTAPSRATGGSCSGAATNSGCRYFLKREISDFSCTMVAVESPETSKAPATAHSPRQRVALPTFDEPANNSQMLDNRAGPMHQFERRVNYVDFIERGRLEDVNQLNHPESNVLLDPNVLSDPHLQALALTVLATLVRNATDEKEARILFEYLAEASVAFPRVFPVVHSLLDQRITKVLEKSHDSGLLRAVLHIVQNMVLGQEPAPHQQHVTFLQGCGFGGLWRFAGPFLPKPAAQQSITAEVCTCLERLVGDLGDVPPLTPPPASPRVLCPPNIIGNIESTPTQGQQQSATAAAALSSAGASSTSTQQYGRSPIGIRYRLMNGEFSEESGQNSLDMS
uniref:Neurofibromin n=1 Tax=Romanomermis culicivorax TaxID=13658 RepID=A0A915KNP1_ROMCU